MKYAIIFAGIVGLAAAAPASPAVTPHDSFECQAMGCDKGKNSSTTASTVIQTATPTSLIYIGGVDKVFPSSFGDTTITPFAFPTMTQIVDPLEYEEEEEDDDDRELEDLEFKIHRLNMDHLLHMDRSYPTALPESLELVERRMPKTLITRKVEAAATGVAQLAQEIKIGGESLVQMLHRLRSDRLPTNLKTILPHIRSTKTPFALTATSTQSAAAVTETATTTETRSSQTLPTDMTRFSTVESPAENLFSIFTASAEPTDLYIRRPSNSH